MRDGDLVCPTLTSILALGFRTVALSTYGLSEDEVNKIQAIEAYRAGHFSANAEHPMLMKLAMWGSLELVRGWNSIAPVGQTVTIETAIRLPNAIAGAATSVVLFGVADLLFGPAVASVTSLLWAVDVNAISINRIGKEDTFLLLFFLLAVWCYERAKRRGVTDPTGAQRWYAGSGVSFGLMLASKYMPHFIGIYGLFNAITDRNPGANRPDRWRFYGSMVAAFLVANAAILMPATWRYCLSYVQGGTLVHHGYLYGGQLYVTNIPISPLGLPPTYYLRFIATKVPIALLPLTLFGLGEIVRRRRERGFVFLRVLIVFLFVPYSLMAAKFLRYMLPMLALIDLTAGVGLVAVLGRLNRWLRSSTPERVAVMAGIVSVSLGSAVAAPAISAPFYSLFQNALGERVAAAGSTFSEETYDFGVREAVSAIAEVAEPSAVIISDVPAVVRLYLQGTGRGDLQSRSLSGQGISHGCEETWVLVQGEHATFENQRVVEQLRRRVEVWREFLAGDVPAAQVFRIGPAQVRTTQVLQ